MIKPLPEKWINNHKHQTCDTTTHYDTTNNAIWKTWVIPPHKLLCPLVSYLTHKKKNLLWDMQQQFQHHGKLSPKEKKLFAWLERTCHRSQVGWSLSQLLRKAKERLSERARNFCSSEKERMKGKWCKEWKRATGVHPVFRKTLVVLWYRARVGDKAINS